MIGRVKMSYRWDGRLVSLCRCGVFLLGLVAEFRQLIPESAADLRSLIAGKLKETITDLRILSIMVIRADLWRSTGFNWKAIYCVNKSKEIKILNQCQAFPRVRTSGPFSLLIIIEKIMGSHNGISMSFKNKITRTFC